MSKQEDSIATLNSLVKVRIAPSPIHGVGIFAMRKIPAGTKLYLEMFPQPYKIPYGSFSKLFPEVSEYILERWPNIINGSAFMYPDSRLQAYCNHSDEPNYDAVNDVTLKDIEFNEEITEDYKKIDNWEKIYPWLVV